jgi:hypothetical protein
MTVCVTVVVEPSCTCAAASLTTGFFATKTSVTFCEEYELMSALLPHEAELALAAEGAGNAESLDAITPAFAAPIDAEDAEEGDADEGDNDDADGVPTSSASTSCAEADIG